MAMVRPDCNVEAPPVVILALALELAPPAAEDAELSNAYEAEGALQRRGPVKERDVANHADIANRPHIAARGFAIPVRVDGAGGVAAGCRRCNGSEEGNSPILHSGLRFVFVFSTLSPEA